MTTVDGPTDPPRHASPATAVVADPPLPAERPAQTTLHDLARRADAFVFGPPPPERLTPRTRAAIEENQRSSEVLVCLVQFAAVAFFGSVYTLTPKAFPESVPFEPVPVVLAAYAIFTGLRLWLAATDRLTRPFLIASILVDVGALMITIWSFHLQYRMPPAIYLKSPTLLYVFILIALRAMRLEASLVIIAGLASMAGWAVLVGYALADGGTGMITRDWAGYMMSSTILIGAEVDKLLTIGAVTAVLAVAVSRARRLMIAAAAERHAAEELSRFFAPEIAGEIRRADLNLEQPGARREAAVLMVDLRGFSDVSTRLTPKETVELLSEYHRRVVPTIHRHGGSIDKYLGDGILATFGALRPSETRAADALAALRDVLAEGQAWQQARASAPVPAPEVNAALDVGTVTLGVVGHESRLEYTIIGDVVNRVAKLEKHARTLGARGLVSAAVLEQAGGAVGLGGLALSRHPGEAVPGLAEPMDLLAVMPGEGPPTDAVPPGSAALSRRSRPDS